MMPELECDNEPKDPFTSDVFLLGVALLTIATIGMLIHDYITR